MVTDESLDIPDEENVGVTFYAEAEQRCQVPASQVTSTNGPRFRK